RSGLTVLVSLMGSSVLSEVDDTSILRTGLSIGYGRPLNWLPPLGSCPRAAGWSAATLCPGPSRTLRDLRFMSAVEVLSGLDMLIQRFSECDPERLARQRKHCKT